MPDDPMIALATEMVGEDEAKKIIEGFKQSGIGTDNPNFEFALMTRLRHQDMVTMMGKSAPITPEQAAAQKADQKAADDKTKAQAAMAKATEAQPGAGAQPGDEVIIRGRIEQVSEKK